MLGEKAMDLVREALRTGETLGPYNEDKVRQVLEEMRLLYGQNLSEVEARQSLTASVHVRHAALERNKRCLLAYVAHRAERVREMRWQFGAVLPEEVRDTLCEPEKAFFAKYGRDLAAYMRAVGDGAGIDLMTDSRPPKSLYIEVRCLQDYGEMETEEGELIVLKRNTQHFLPRTLCEPLIRQGILEHVT